MTTIGQLIPGKTGFPLKLTENSTINQPVFKMEAIESIKRAKIKLTMNQPFFATLALGLEYIENPMIETACTDGKKLEYNPDFIKSLIPDEVTGLICHEVLHIALLHHLRKGKRDHKLWNAACDYAVNLLLLEQKMKIPEGGLIDYRFKGKSAEEIYTILEKEGYQPKDNGIGEVIEPREGDLQELEAEMKQKIVSALTVAKMAGKEMGSIGEEIVQLIQPKINWREVLNRFLTETAKNDYIWTRPNSRYIQLGLYLPSLESLEIGRCCFVRDTSISVDAELLSEIESELQEASTLFKFPVTVIDCDTEVRQVIEMEQGNKKSRFVAWSFC